MPRAQLNENGFALLPGAVAPAWLERLAARMPSWELLPSARQRHGATFAVSNLLRGDTELAGLLDECGVTARVSETLGQRAFPIDALLFDKVPETNWKVPGHQDVVMPVAETASEEGFSGWTTRDNVTCVQPPVAVLEDLVAARVHFDDSSEENGPLAVVPGSHRLGRIAERKLAELSPGDYRVCAASAGDVLLMRPLLVHRSAPSARPLHRRVLHVVYAWREAGERVRWRR